MADERIASVPPGAATAATTPSGDSFTATPQAHSGGSGVPLTGATPHPWHWAVWGVLATIAVMLVGSVVFQAGPSKDPGGQLPAGMPSASDHGRGVKAPASLNAIDSWVGRPAPTNRRDERSTPAPLAASGETKPVPFGGPARLGVPADEQRGATSASAGQVKQATHDGLSYETTIPRPTKKGYYEPKLVPYPEGKPVFVNGYYRKDGTYVRPHFRSLPRK